MPAALLVERNHSGRPAVAIATPLQIRRQGPAVEARAEIWTGLPPNTGAAAVRQIAWQCSLNKNCNAEPAEPTGVTYV